MVMMPLALAWVSTLPADAGSRAVRMRTFAPLFIIDCAITTNWVALLFAFWMSQVRLSALHRAFSAIGSEEIQRLDDCRSGRMMPTFAPLPSIAPPPEPPVAGADDAAAEVAPPAAADVAGGAEVLPPPPLELQAASANAAATPIAATCTLLLRMQNA